MAWLAKKFRIDTGTRFDTSRNAAAIRNKFATFYRTVQIWIDAVIRLAMSNKGT